jgi:carbonic anhydrase
MDRLITIDTPDDIPAPFRETPIARFLGYHNLGLAFGTYSAPELLVGMCMDNRKMLRLPDNFAVILRTGGANLRHSEFKISYAIAVSGVQAIALVAHTQCGMVNLTARREQFIQGLVERAGWEPEWAAQHFDSFAPLFEIGNEVDFVLSEAQRLRLRYRGIPIIPMLYRVEDNRIYLLREDAATSTAEGNHGDE